ncbi:BTAD domain-containing putative transcriptional regulator [Lentzea sp. NPDC042327]|uniref:AfsR/SARP family transcriptional regulator n=1 Tax=Lentzea sp. NPDC042327 TaxID=3154801 RepID=UPI0034010FCB
MKFRVWGEVGVYVDGRREGPKVKKASWLLAFLLLNNGKAVELDSLREWLWDDVPASADGEVAKLMSDLRKLLERVGYPDALWSKDGLRCLKVPDELVDNRRFAELMAKAHAADRRTPVGLREAGAALEQALGLTERGPLTGVFTSRAELQRTRLRDDRHDAEILAVQVGTELGKHQALIGTARRMHLESPENEEVTLLAARVLHLCGRTNEVGTVIKRHQDALAELGHIPTKEIREMHTRILQNDAGLQPLVQKQAAPVSNRLVVAFKTDPRDVEFLRRLVPDAFERNDIAMRAEGGNLTCDLPAQATPLLVIERCLSRLSEMVDRPVSTGVAVDDAQRAHDLAGSRTAQERLQTAAGRYLVVAISEELYELVEKPDRETYRRAADVNGWVCVPGLSPQPDEPSVEAKPQDEKAAQKSYSFAFNGTTSIGTQHNGDAVHHHYLGGRR